jgi:hypothetical protein
VEIVEATGVVEIEAETVEVFREAVLQAVVLVDSPEGDLAVDFPEVDPARVPRGGASIQQPSLDDSTATAMA